MKLLNYEVDRDKPLTILEVACGILALVAPILAIMLIAIATSGCVYRGAKVTEGTDLAIGLNVPVSEGTLQLQVLNYLSGFRVGVDRNAIMTVKYTVAETNSYFGCVSTATAKTADVTVEPCETSTSEAEPQSR